MRRFHPATTIKVLDDISQGAVYQVKCPVCVSRKMMQPHNWEKDREDSGYLDALGCGEVDKTTSTTLQHVSSELEHGNFEDLFDPIWLPTRMYTISPISTAFLKGCLKFGISTIQYRAHLPQLGSLRHDWLKVARPVTCPACSGWKTNSYSPVPRPSTWQTRLVASAQAFPAIKTDRESKCRHLNSRWT